MPRPKLILLVGLPGSGKTTYARAQGWPILSSDDLREMLLDDPRDQSINRRIFALLRQLVRVRLELRRPVTCIDATSLTPRERRAYIKTAQLYDAEIEAVFFNVPLEECLRRNHGRDRTVPLDIMHKMAARLRPPHEEEGFTRVTIAG